MMRSWGSVRRSEKLMENFLDAVHDCNLMKAPYKGSKYTWHRGRGRGAVYERLDRCLVTKVGSIFSQRH